MRFTKPGLAAFSLVLAALLWVLVFVVKPVEFWVMLSLSTLILLAVSIAINRDKFSASLDLKSVALGLLSGLALYALFYAGFQVTKSSPTFSEGVHDVYLLRSIPAAITGVLIVFPIAPSEEVYWRGLIQRRFSENLGPWSGFLLATLAYGLVHFPTFNIPLILTALIGGLVWGFIYKVTGRLVPVMVSHVVFDLLVFVVLPIS